MKVIQIGMAKSGNYWLYTILKQILSLSGQWQGSFIQNQPLYAEAKKLTLSVKDQIDIDVMNIEDTGVYYRISSLPPHRIANLANYLDQSSLVWTHSPFCTRSLQVLSHFSKKVYICRDGRDVAVSAARFAMTPYKQTFYPNRFNTPEEYLENCLDGKARSWAKHCAGYLICPDIYWVFYERLLHDFDREIEGLLNYLEIDLSAEDKAQVKNLASFETMKKDSPDHLKKGKSGNWSSFMNEYQQKRFIEIAGSVLEVLGYQVNVSPPTATKLPVRPQSISPELLKAYQKNGVGGSKKPALLPRALQKLNRLIFQTLKAKKSEYPVKIEMQTSKGSIYLEACSPVEYYRLKTASYGYEKDFLVRFTGELEADDIVFDIGANVGLTTVYAAAFTENGQVIAFESDPDTLGYLKHNLGLNKFSHVDFVPWVLGDTEGQATLCPEAAGFVSGPREDRPVISNDKTRVQARTLDSAILSGDLPLPTVLKIDIEGAVVLCLRGGSKLLNAEIGDKPRLIFLKLYPDLLASFNSSSDQVHRFLLSKGYSVVWEQQRNAQIHYCYKTN